MAGQDLSAHGNGLVDRVIELVIRGGGPLKGAVEIADQHLIAAGVTVRRRCAA